MRLKLKTSLLLGYLLLGMIAILLSLTGIYSINKIAGTPDKILKDNYGSIVAAQNMIDELDNMDNAVISYIAESKSKPESEKLFDSARTKYYENLKLCEGNITEHGEEKLMAEIRKYSDAYINNFKNNK